MCINSNLFYFYFNFILLPLNLVNIELLWFLHFKLVLSVLGQSKNNYV